jgi:dolichyl-diphosphooligosaccharide--protein glycosyltransferase
MLLVVPAFSIAFGVALGMIFKYLSKWISKEMNINNYVAKAVIIILLSLLLIGPFRSARATSINEIPSMNDAWYASLTKINQNATPDAVINSWWDFGHWFKQIGDRAVTFDGTSQNTPMAHWIGNSLLTGDEKTSVGILRMLGCGSNTAFEELDEVVNDTAESVNLLYEIIVVDKEDAREILENYEALNARTLSDDKIDAILENTHCEPPENYYIASDDMIGKSGVWAHFGSWDFNRALIYNKLKQRAFRRDKTRSMEFLKDRFGYSDEKAENIFFDVQSITTSREANDWIAPWPSYASGLTGCPRVNNESIRCNMGQFFVEINLTSMDANIPSQQGIVHPDTFVYPTEEGIEVKSYNNTIGVSLLLIPTGPDSYNSMLMAPQLTPSMFSRLYFLNGHGLEHFRLFSFERSVTGNQIYVYKVDWDGGEQNVLDIFKEPEAEDEELQISEVEIMENKTEDTTDNQSPGVSIQIE